MPPSAADAQGPERVSKSTKYGQQSPISERWNGDKKIILWCLASAGVVNRVLKRSGREERVTHCSHADCGLDGPTTIHEGGVTAMEAGLWKLNQQEEKYSEELDALLTEFPKLQVQVAVKVAAKKVQR